MLPTRLQLNPEMRRIRRSLTKQLTTCENTSSLFVLDLAGSANAPMDFSENSGRVFNMRKGISDRSTLMNWGNSSSDSLRSHLPTRPLAHASDARIRGDLEHWAAFLVKLPELGEPVLGIHAHAAELVHVEFFAILTNALLLEKDGGLGIVDFDGMATITNNQLKDTRTKALKTMSNARFVKR